MKKTLQTTYALIAELLVHPDHRDRQRLESLDASLEHAPCSLREPLRQVLDSPRADSADEYVQTLELDPPCPLYLGTYKFDEPSTCRAAGSSHRNAYMLELKNLYRHFGLELARAEMPDFVPLVADFLGISLNLQPPRAEGLRRYLLEELVRPSLEPMHAKLTEYESVYALAVGALRDAVDRDLIALGDSPAWSPNPDEHLADKMNCDKRLANITDWLIEDQDVPNRAS